MGSSNQRPAPFPPGHHLSEHYKVEGLVRLAEGRMFYLANDDRPDRPRRFCWECGSDDTTRGGTHCAACGAEMSLRRFLVSVRWDQAEFAAFSAYFDRRLDHPGFASAVDVFVQEGVLCAVSPWDGEGLMLDESGPLPIDRVMDLAQRGTGMLAFLHASGVRLSSLSQANLLVAADGRFLLFDPAVAEVMDGPVPEELRNREVAWLGEILRRYTPVYERDLGDFFQRAEQGIFGSPMEFGRALVEYLKTATAGPDISHAAMSDVGLSRSLNEDNWGWTNVCADLDLFVVTDGMGGHDKGEVASELAVTTICEESRRRLGAGVDLTPERLENSLEESFQRGNNAIKEYSERLRSDMGTTMVATLIYQRRLAYMANVGDSRGYLMRGGVLHQVSRDHSLVARMVDQGRITQEEARTHPHSNILLRTVGTERDVDIDIFSVQLEPGDRVLMCSDGLWGEVEDGDIEAILNHYEDPRVACRELVRAAHHGGGRDNVTVMLVNVPEA